MATSDYSSTFTSSSDGECLFQSPAQIMVRQDIGWEPMGIGGLSRIEIKQKPNILNNEGFEYFIEAYKLTSSNERNINLESKLDSDTSYFRISPTFHCWTTKKDKIGLTFDTYEAAENFEKLFHQILKRLEKGSCQQQDENQSNLNANNSDKNTRTSRATKDELIIKSWGSCQHIGQGDNIPCQMKCFQSPPTACSEIHNYVVSPNLDSLSRHYHSPSAASAPCLLRLNIVPTFEAVPGSPVNDGEPPTVTGWLARLLTCVWKRTQGGENPLSRSSANSGSCSSHQKTRKHPRTSQDGPSCTSAIQDSSVSNEGTSGDNMMTWLPKRVRNSHRPGILICVYCRRRFRPQSNPPGSCELAPDKARQLVDILTCRPCGHQFIQCFYRSISNPSVADSDLSDSLPSPYSCCGRSAPSPPDPGDNAAYTSSTNTIRIDYRLNKAALPNKCQRLKSRSGRRKRCLLCLMYCLLPCVCCYRPCLSCYESCLDRGLVGGRHSVIHHRSQH